MGAIEVTHEALNARLRDATPDSALAFGASCLYRVLPLIDACSTSRVDPASKERLLAPGLDEKGMHGCLRELGNTVQEPSFPVGCEELGDAPAMAGEIVLRGLAPGFVLREWADWASTLTLDISQEFDAMLDESDSHGVVFRPAGENADLTPMEFAELHEQVRTLSLLAERPRDEPELDELIRAGARRTADTLTHLT
ncbi:hypothetical protein [Actinomadura sp. WMMA1423]|uniref:hypothetical protein n=1 Tax=Actinomadura sp. WMMA1423 TaxID=2591108 RepID=UPI001146E60B|nr:hypothetical protein [Actinomadura sp. WMMA1423]